MNKQKRFLSTALTARAAAQNVEMAVVDTCVGLDKTKQKLGKLRKTKLSQNKATQCADHGA